MIKNITQAMVWFNVAGSFRHKNALSNLAKAERRAKSYEIDAARYIAGKCIGSNYQECGEQWDLNDDIIKAEAKVRGCGGIFDSEPREVLKRATAETKKQEKAKGTIIRWML